MSLEDFAIWGGYPFWFRKANFCDDFDIAVLHQLEWVEGAKNRGVS
jgi:hypothetical protein